MLATLPALQALSLTRTSVAEIDLTGTPALESLSISTTTTLTNVAGLAGLSQLTSFSVQSIGPITTNDITPVLPPQVEIVQFNLVGGDAIDATPLAQLRELLLISCADVDSISMNGLSNLQRLVLSGMDAIDSAVPVDSLSGLTSIVIRENLLLPSISLGSTLTTLNTVDVSNNDALVSLSLDGLSSLSSLTNQNNAAMLDLAFSNLPIGSLTVQSSPALTSLTLNALPSLTSLTINQAGIASVDVSSLAALSALSVNVVPNLLELVALPVSLQSITVSNADVLSKIDVNGLVQLTSLTVDVAPIHELGTDGLSALESLQVLVMHNTALGGVCRVPTSLVLCDLTFSNEVM